MKTFCVAPNSRDSGNTKIHDHLNNVSVTVCLLLLGAIQVLRNADGGGGVWFSGKKRYEGVMFNVISVTRGWVEVQFPEK